MERVEILISREQVLERVKELAKKIEEDYKGEELVCVALLKGSFIFFADLVREIKSPVQIDFMNVSSYGNASETSGVVRILKDTDADISGKNVLLVEDIIDTGYTLEYVKKFLSNKGAKSVKCVSLLDKPERRKIDIPIEYVGFEVPDKFIVGYGIDYAQKYRNLPYIAVVLFD